MTHDRKVTVHYLVHFFLEHPVDATHLKRFATLRGEILM